MSGWAYAAKVCGHARQRWGTPAAPVRVQQGRKLTLRALSVRLQGRWLPLSNLPVRGFSGGPVVKDLPSGRGYQFNS